MGGLPDNYDLWERHDRERERELEKYPLCDNCREHITDEHFYNINGTFICETCLNEDFRKRTEDYMEE
jgi:formylmethanofuran dehydrogenase subunit E